jgi:hypothetical protein
MQAVSQRTGFVTTINLLGSRRLFFGPKQELYRSEFLGWLWRGIVDLPNHPIALGMDIDAQFDALGIGGVLCFSVGGVGIGIGFCFHITSLGVAQFRSPANTHAIYKYFTPLGLRLAASPTKQKILGRWVEVTGDGDQRPNAKRTAAEKPFAIHRSKYQTVKNDLNFT